MVELHSVNLIYGFVVGVQTEELEGDNYMIISLGLIEIILVW